MRTREPSPAHERLAGGDLPGLRAVARHALPNVLESTIIPTALFYVGWMAFGKLTAFGIALFWAAAMIVRRSVSGRRMPGLLVLTTLVLTARTAVAVATGSTLLYFAQPVATTALVGMVFLGSVALGRPLVGRLVRDFVPLPVHVTERPDVIRHLRNLSLLWAGVNFVNAIVALVLLMNLTVPSYIATKTISSMLITWTGVGLTTVWSTRVARRAGLRTAPAFPA